MGFGRYAAYKDRGEFIWRIGYGSKELHERVICPFTRASEKEILEQLQLDLETLSYKVSRLIYWPLKDKQKAAVLSYAHSMEFSKFKESELLEIINAGAKKKEIIQIWSPYINTFWSSFGPEMVDRRRSELNLFLAPDKEIPTLVKHNCSLNQCLLNLPVTYNGNPNQIKAINYLEKKLLEFDPSGEVVRRFFRYWNQPPGNLGSPKNL
jgi:GH24 family phage-related lysozyme (muramidase)